MAPHRDETRKTWDNQKDGKNNQWLVHVFAMEYVMELTSVRSLPAILTFQYSLQLPSNCPVQMDNPTLSILLSRPQPLNRSRLSSHRLMFCAAGCQTPLMSTSPQTLHVCLERTYIPRKPCCRCTAISTYYGVISHSQANPVLYVG